MQNKLRNTFDAHVRTMKDFNVRVERLDNFGISQLAKSGRLRTVVGLILGERRRRGMRHPTQEEIDAFVDNIRFFIQDNEPISFRNLAKGYCALPLPDEIKKEFNRCRANLNHWLDSKSSLGMKDGPFTHRKVFETFIYGDVAHQNFAKCRLFGKMRQSSISFPLWETLFVEILGKFTRFLDQAVSVNKKAIAHLNGQKSPCTHETTF